MGIGAKFADDKSNYITPDAQTEATWDKTRPVLIVIAMFPCPWLCVAAAVVHRTMDKVRFRGSYVTGLTGPSGRRRMGPWAMSSRFFGQDSRT